MNLIVLGKPTPSKTDEFSEKFQTAFDGKILVCDFALALALALALARARALARALAVAVALALSYWFLLPSSTVYYFHFFDGMDINFRFLLQLL